jgi:hypothetical protein
MEHNKHIIVPRKYRKDKTEVSCVVKYLMFGFNVLFWVSAIQWNHFFSDTKWNLFSFMVGYIHVGFISV